ncbi:MAG: 50S ribosomal protein L3 [Bacteroidetes bacterium]|nr:50S ribosomal protein L3 [Bacteroidota bacterium]
MSKGLLGIKVGMTSIFDKDGNHFPCTVIEVEPNVVTQIRTKERDGYSAVQLALGNKKEKRTAKSMRGHFEAAGTTPKRHVREFPLSESELSLGDEIRLEDVFTEGEIINVSGTSKGKGFQGVVKRHKFRGVNDATHGQHNRQRAPGSIGAGSDPSRVFKGMRMAGRMGTDRVTIKNLKVMRVMSDQNAILVIGAVPGPINGLVELRKKQ